MNILLEMQKETNTSPTRTRTRFKPICLAQTNSINFFSVVYKLLVDDVLTVQSSKTQIVVAPNKKPERNEINK